MSLIGGVADRHTGRGHPSRVAAFSAGKTGTSIAVSTSMFPERSQPWSAGAIAEGDHVCHFHRTEEEQRATVLPFLKAGLLSGENAIWFTDSGLPELPPEPFWTEALRCGQLRLAGRRARAQAFAELEQLDGPIRIVGGVSTGVDSAGEFEARLAALLSFRRVRALCSFREDALSPRGQLDLLRSHPKVLREGLLLENFAYVSPRESCQGDAAQRELSHWNACFTQFRKCQDELQRVRADLERTNEELAQFAYVASHDLQEPLRTVNTFLGMLQRNQRDRLDEKSHHYISYALDGVERMHRLIQALLEYSRANRASQPNTRVPGDAVLDSALQNLRAELESSQATVTHSQLPKIEGDPKQLQQVFQNLIHNALRYRGSSRPSIHVSCDRSSDRYVFQIRDNGMGFDMAYAEQIFQPFRRLHTQQEIPGSGLGLTVCRKIVRRHGGEMWASARPGSGASFFFSLPASRSAAA